MKKIFTSLLIALLFHNCNYLNIVPDNVATLDHAFSDKNTTERYLLTCYAGLPTECSLYSNPAFLAGDEIWTWENIIGYPETPYIYFAWMIARGKQNTNDPYINYYDGLTLGSPLFQVIRRCNTFIERVDGVLGLDAKYSIPWKAEAKVIKAYCIFYLMRMYGPIPLIKENLAISAPPEAIRFKRNTWDECVDYVVQLLDEATPDLPLSVDNKAKDLGRMTQAISLAIKSKVLITAASPQFNGNPFYEDFTNKDGQKLFGPKDDSKWLRAAEACKAAIDTAIAGGAELYKYKENPDMNDTVRFEYTIRKSVTDEDWNNELIWGSVKEPGGIQQFAQPYLMTTPTTIYVPRVIGVTMKIAKQYYTSNGVPIEEDKTWKGRDIEELRTPAGAEKYRITDATAQLNFDREPRFYASLGFNRGVWYGAGRSYESPYTIQHYNHELANEKVGECACITGYFAKKVINMETYQDEYDFHYEPYPWPVIRLADLYLLYAEALNETEGPSPAVYEYLDKIRERAGLKGVLASWAEYSTDPSKPNTQSGLREIIHRERLIELALEGQRFWDLRRWLKAEKEFRVPVSGWDITQTKENAELYYKEKTLFLQNFTMRDYLWPIRQYTLTVNPNLSQTIGW